MNGDGLPDIVYESNGNLYVRYNRTGKTNMLKSIKNSIGGKIGLDYTRVGNSDKVSKKYKFCRKNRQLFQYNINKKKKKL